jgi:Ca-activated chloride channel family protein
MEARNNQQAIAAFNCLLLFLPIIFCSCSDDGSDSDRPGKSIPKISGKSPTLSIVAGSESKEIEDIIVECGRKNGIAVQMHYSGSVDMMLAIKNVDFPHDAVLPASSIWLRLGDQAFHRVKEEASIMRSPVGLGVKKSLAASLGWIGREVTVADILEAVRSKRFKFAMTSATQSNSGFSSYIGMLIALAGNPDVLSRAHLDQVGLQRDIKNLLAAVNRGSGSSGWLMHTFVDDYDRLDAMFNYESMIIAANQRLLEKNKEPLYIIYPTDGLAVADSTLAFINKPDQPDNRKKLEAFITLRDCLLTEKVQQQILKRGFRAGLIGMNPGKAPRSVYNPEWGIDLYRTISPIVWPDAAVTKDALTLYQTVFRKPSLTVFAIDCSGSMKGEGLRDLKEALTNLFDPAAANQYLIQTGSADIIVVNPFDDDFLWPKPRVVKGNNPLEIRRLIEAIQSLYPRGKTNIYKPVAAAWRYFESLGPNIEDYLPSVILMTDGRSNIGSLEELMNVWRRLKPGFEMPPVFCIVYGDADDAQLNHLAKSTYGRVFDGRHGGLNKAFRSAKGYN